MIGFLHHIRLRNIQQDVIGFFLNVIEAHVKLEDIGIGTYVGVSTRVNGLSFILFYKLEMNGFRGELISDTHLSSSKYTDQQISDIFPGSPDNLVLAGDIGDPDSPSLYTALQFAKQRYKRVIMVPGNHEFDTIEPRSKKSPASVISWFRKLDEQWDNFHFFYRRNEIIDGVRILGATCWTTSPKMDTWSNVISQEGKKDIEFLELNLRKSTIPTLIVSHYPPTLRVLQTPFTEKITQYDYAQDLERIFHYPLHTWTFGHVHQKYDQQLPYSSSMSGAGKVRLLCNPYGYHNEEIAAHRPKPFSIGFASM